MQEMDAKYALFRHSSNKNLHFCKFCGADGQVRTGDLILTWGEIFSVLSDAPYVSTRIPASHRGRINGVTSVFTAAVTGCIDLAVGRIYDRSGSTWAWILILAVALGSIMATVILKQCDKKAYPKLYKA